MNRTRRYHQPIDQPTKDRVVELLRCGLSTIQAADRTGVGQSTAAQIARQAGLVFSKPGSKSGRWIDSQEQTDMSNGQTSDEWNMPLDDYIALLPHEDERRVETVEVTDTPVMPLLTSDDDDLQAAARLLDQAAEVRRIDVALITELQSRVDDLMLRLGTAALSAQSEYEKYDRQIVQLETENKRLNDQIKVEISRGFLRKSMDNLRSVLE